jgi:tetratricopeptide (TPR) repeat protein
MIKTSSMPRFLAAGAFALTLSLGATVAFPALSADSGGGSSTPVNCKSGTTYNSHTGKCEKTSMLDDKTLTEQGHALALAGYYENALEALMAVRDKNNSTVLTYIGYANRKMGKTDEGIDWYKKSLALDPNNPYTHEYLGEGYVSAGRMDLARAQLATLETICGSKACEQYKGLAAAIAGEPESWGG